MSKTKPGMPSPALTEDDVKRILCVCMDRLGERLQERMSYLGDIATPTETIDLIAEELYRLPITIEFMLQATDKETAEGIVNRLDRIEKTNKSIRKKYGLPDPPKDSDSSEGKTPHATESQKGVYSDVPPYE